MKTGNFLNFIIASSFLFSCDKGVEPPENTSQISSITTSTPVQLSSQTITSTGGTITIQSPENSLNGMTIKFPVNSVSSSQTITIESAAITGQKINKDLSIISPLITIKSSGIYSDSMITLTIPVKVPAGHFAMGFMLDSSNSEVEGMPLLGMWKDSVTIATRHLASSSPTVTGLNKSFAAPVHIGNIFIASIAISTLKTLGAIKTDFTPGADDWEFPNYGSYITEARGGHCLGQSLGSIWYFYERNVKLSEPSLYRRYVQTPSISNLWQDNPSGYRLCSMLQYDYKHNNNPLLNSYIENLKDHDNDSLSWYAFAYSMHITHQPQLVGIISSLGGGHAMVAYDIDMASGKIYIADPNLPGNLSREILYTNNMFEPYMGGANASSPGKSYDMVGFLGKTAFVNWSQIAKRWDERDNNIIGKNLFPSYKLYYVDTADQEVEISDSAVTANVDTFFIAAKSSDVAVNVADDGYQQLTLYTVNGTSVWTNYSTASAQPYIAVILKPGLNRCGFYLQSLYSDDGGTTVNSNYVDFFWLDIFKSKLAILPASLTGKKDTAYQFAAATGGTAPTLARYTWKVINGSGLTLKEEAHNGLDTTFTYTFKDTGSYQVNVELYDNGLKKSIGKKTAPVTIGSPLLEKLKKAKHIKIVLNGMLSPSDTTGALLLESGSKLPKITIENWNTKEGVVGTIIWSNDTFNLTYTHSITMSGSTQNTTGTITGALAKTGSSLAWLKASETTVIGTPGVGLTTTVQEDIVCPVIPITDFSPIDIELGADLSPPDVEPVITTATYLSTSVLDGSTTSTSKLKQILWDHPSLYFSVEFTGN